MRFTVSATALSDALSQVQRVTPARPALMAYSAVSLVASGSTVELTGSDGELTIRVALPITPESDGGSLVQPRPLSQWLQTVGDVVLAVFDDGSGDLVVTAPGAAPYRFRTVAATFPQTPRLTGKPQTVDLTHLPQALAAVRAAVDRDHKVVQLVSAGSQLRINATDSYRLCQAVLDGAGFGDFSGMVPLAILDQISPDTDTVVVDTAGRMIEWRSAHITYTARLAAVAFPAVDSVLSVLPEHKVALPTAALRTALGRLATIVDQEPLRCQLTHDTVTLSVASSPLGSGSESIPLAAGPSIPFEFGVNLTYLAEALANQGDGPVTLSYSGATQALFFVSTGAVSVTAAVMPVRLGT